MKVSDEARQHYSDRIVEYQTEIQRLTAREGEVRASLTPGPATNSMRLSLSQDSLDQVSYYILMNTLSVALLGVKSESFLNEARKRVYKAIIYAEEAVSPLIDVPFSEYEEGVSALEDVGDELRFSFLCKLGFSIDAIQDGFGTNSKWKWSFVEIEGRYAVIAKNLVNLKTFVARMDPRVDGYEARTGHMALCKELLQKAADRYREKYELSTLRLDDMKLAISYLAALKRLHTMIGEDEGVDVVAKKIDIWKAKMESDERKSKDRAKNAK
jgi:hypothetical protein